nr:hypothetical protein Itr_chr04CG20480 [Ipomoea trifida]GLL29736.1 hypothetical protein Itr_chr06CG14390 [Ipomoea trifida]GLL31431.1 hypothetical protein Itr_chr07CG09440 [Ipomoea trifida]
MEFFTDQPRRRDHHLLLRSAAVPWRSSPEPPTTVDLLCRRFPCWLERERERDGRSPVAVLLWSKGPRRGGIRQG